MKATDFAQPQPQDPNFKERARDMVSQMLAAMERDDVMVSFRPNGSPETGLTVTVDFEFLIQVPDVIESTKGEDA